MCVCVCVCVCVYLKDALGERRLLRELLEILGVGIVIGGEVGLEHPQLVVFERRPQTLRLLLLLLLPLHGAAGEQRRRRRFQSVVRHVVVPFCATAKQKQTK